METRSHSGLRIDDRGQGHTLISPERVQETGCGTAPPFVEACGRVVARSATNAPDDKIRNLIERALGLTWIDLGARGFALAHAVKCAITPLDGHQNPPCQVVNVCAPRHLAQEIRALSVRPEVVVTMGRMAYRATARALEAADGHPLGLSFTKPPATARPGGTGYVIATRNGTLALFASDFSPRNKGVREATAVLRKAATVAGLVDQA